MGKKNFTRQTKLSTEEIIRLINDVENPTYPRCLLVNELGIIVDEEDNEDAREKLRELLNTEDECEQVKYASYCWLCLTPKTEETLAALQVFMNNSENTELVEMAAENNIHFHFN